ncbi:MAG TPA: L-histidine N(alpha)-methyltransferase [Thermoanaerobaculia bacterium]|nr:L-histidine N(alpha)-methyltransferase [Thermoanaerobaculia bacterium]
METTANQAFELIDLLPSPSDFRREVLDGLRRAQKQIPPKFFYDARGSALFDDITRLKEYYLTRTETDMLAERAGEIAASLGRDATIVELGSGSSRKVRLLLDELQGKVTYVTVDISREHLLAAVAALCDEYPALRVIAVCTDYTRGIGIPLENLPARCMAFFPGSTVGNFEPAEARQFFAMTAGYLRSGDSLLVGVDLKKDRDILDRAYNDAAGVTADFNRNLLVRINRELGADFEVEAFRHVAFYDEGHGRIEMHLLAEKEMTVHLGGERILFKKGETIHTENSYKYSVADFHELIRGSGFRAAATWTDADSLFSIHHLVVDR